MQRSLLESLDLPSGLKRLSNAEMITLAQEVRDAIVEVVSCNGGHLAPSLGVVELTVALLQAMDFPRDRVVWDVGHQCYAYKLLTDRRGRFHTLRQAGGLSGFPKPSESPYDCFATGHASTAISAALGIAHARDLAGERYKVAAVVGDGALGGGMAWEAMNNAGASKANLLVILNDNNMSISPSIGSLASHIARLRSMPLYRSVEDGAQRFFGKMPVGGGFVKKTTQLLKRGLTNWVSPTSGTIFEALGFEYLGPIDGHDMPQLRRVIAQARAMHGPVLLHVVTTKGKGYYQAEHKPRRYHGVGPFDSSNGKVSGKTRRTYTDAFSTALNQIARKDPRIVAVTAAMPDGTGLAAFAKRYPSRFFNVGIAEAHAVTFAAGLASAGARPVVAIYSTFLQRAYDQIIEDVCLQNLPVVLALDRAGIVGEDGPTHHGAFDLSYLRHIPNLAVMAPKDSVELADMLLTAVSMGAPVAIRYPRAEATGRRRLPMKILPVGCSELLREGSDLAIIGVGPVVDHAVQVSDDLRSHRIKARVINARFIKPLDESAIVAAASECGALLLVEENTGLGGFSGAVLECLAKNDVTGVAVETIALPDAFLAHGKAADIRAEHDLSIAGLTSAANRLLARLGRRVAEVGDEVVIRQGI